MGIVSGSREFLHLYIMYIEAQGVHLNHYNGVADQQITHSSFNWHKDSFKDVETRPNGSLKCQLKPQNCYSLHALKAFYISYFIPAFTVRLLSFSSSLFHEWVRLKAMSLFWIFTLTFYKYFPHFLNKEHAVVECRAFAIINARR